MPHRAGVRFLVARGQHRRRPRKTELERLAAAWRTKWDGRWTFAVAEDSFHHEDGGLALVFAVRPRKVLAFGKGTFAHTRHVFTESH
ncbi:hypothetical protein [Frankia sp. EAN1pec]|uniref:hypothetical protein n=1 Tax=Parafrankia sp. (strain EAN1pec) TaxID=298653 RepID=UPI0002DAC9BA